ncbi:MAG TPA: nucleoside transporter C-terminal domain-containing protein [Bacteroidota bacterium]|nr:nucleoside transporter C-terminal domain-containing protein [Bacteroidota bacterium]
MNIESVIRGIIGVFFLLFIAYLFSNNKRLIKWKMVFTAIGIQFLFAIFILYGEKLRAIFYPLALPKDILNWLGAVIVQLLHFTIEGASFVFGRLAINNGSESLGIFFAFQVLPTIIFISSITSILYFLGILQVIVKGMAWVMAKLLGTSGAESLSNTANIFVGQTEAPLLIRPYIAKMTNSELLTIMIGGMATIAGGVMASYIQMLGQAYANINHLPIEEAQIKFAIQLLAASTMAAPASLAIAKILYPETEEPVTRGTVKIKIEKNSSNIIEAAAVGAGDGLQLALNVAAMLIAFIALIALLNYVLIWIGNLVGINAWLMQQYNSPLSLQLIFGIILQFIAYCIGVPWADALHFGSLIGTKVALNEFVAFLDMAKMIQGGLLTEKGTIMATYALCGFANFGSIAILIGGLSPMAPERRKDISALGLKAVLGGTIANLMTATLAGILLG